MYYWKIDCDVQNNNKITLKDNLPEELLSLACSLLGIVSFLLKQQYQEAYQMRLHLLSSKDDLEYTQHIVMTGCFKWMNFKGSYCLNALTMCLRNIGTNKERKTSITE